MCGRVFRRRCIVAPISVLHRTNSRHGDELMMRLLMADEEGDRMSGDGWIMDRAALRFAS